MAPRPGPFRDFFESLALCEREGGGGHPFVVTSKEPRVEAVLWSDDDDSDEEEEEEDEEEAPGSFADPFVSKFCYTLQHCSFALNRGPAFRNQMYEEQVRVNDVVVFTPLCCCCGSFRSGVSSMFCVMCAEPEHFDRFFARGVSCCSSLDSFSFPFPEYGPAKEVLFAFMFEVFDEVKFVSSALSDSCLASGKQRFYTYTVNGVPYTTVMNYSNLLKVERSPVLTDAPPLELDLDFRHNRRYFNRLANLDSFVPDETLEVGCTPEGARAFLKANHNRKLGLFRALEGYDAAVKRLCSALEKHPRVNRSDLSLVMKHATRVRWLAAKPADPTELSLAVRTRRGDAAELLAHSRRGTECSLVCRVESNVVDFLRFSLLRALHAIRSPRGLKFCLCSVAPATGVDEAWFGFKFVSLPSGEGSGAPAPKRMKRLVAVVVREGGGGRTWCD